MDIWLINKSTLNPELTPAVMGAVAAACQIQLYRDYAPLHQSAGCDVHVAASTADVPPNGCIITIADKAAEEGALGDHETDAAGRPQGRIFLAPILVNGGTLTQGALSLSCVISHEILEMIGDPYIVDWSDTLKGYDYAKELADPVEADSYSIDGVSVSNFVGPRYFSAGPGPYDFLGTLTAPFSIAQGGYAIKRAFGTVSQVFGAAYPEWRKDAISGRAALRMTLPPGAQ